MLFLAHISRAGFFGSSQVEMSLFDRGWLLCWFYIYSLCDDRVRIFFEVLINEKLSCAFFTENYNKHLLNSLNLNITTAPVLQMRKLKLRSL